ncbi:MAG TPA: hypothetical protein VD788_07485, partial [Candidatus Polarisedimenticolaceae bacterium]|nr:hypothetical protein [Candidatus Polarisedimenticolaceae bacterium]
GTAVWTAGDADVPGLMARVVLYDMPDAVDADACLAALGARLDLASDAVGGVRRYRLGARPVIEYEVREHRGVEVNQRNLHGYLYHDRACAEVHVSFIGYQGQPHMLLERVITSVEIVATDGTDGGDSQ